MQTRKNAPMLYRLLGHERAAFTSEQLEKMVSDGLLDLGTMVIRDGEGFAAPIGSRAEFEHLRERHLLPKAPP